MSGLWAKAHAAALLWARLASDLFDGDEMTCLARSPLTDLAGMTEVPSVVWFDPARRVVAINRREDWE